MEANLEEFMEESNISSEDEDLLVESFNMRRMPYKKSQFDEYMRNLKEDEVIDFFFDRIFPENGDSGATHIHIKDGVKAYYIFKNFNCYSAFGEYTDLEDKEQMELKWYDLIARGIIEAINIFRIETKEQILYEKDIRNANIENVLSLNDPTIFHSNALKIPPTVNNIGCFNVNGNHINIGDVKMTTTIIVTDDQSNGLFNKRISFMENMSRLFNNKIPWDKETEHKRIRLAQKSVLFEIKSKQYLVPAGEFAPLKKIHTSGLDAIEFWYYDDNKKAVRDTCYELIKRNLMKFVVPNQIDDYIVFLRNSKVLIIDKRSPTLEKNLIDVNEIKYSLDNLLLYNPTPIEDAIAIDAYKVKKFNEVIDFFKPFCRGRKYQYSIVLSILHDTLKLSEHIDNRMKLESVIGTWTTKKKFTGLIKQFIKFYDTKYESKFYGSPINRVEVLDNQKQSIIFLKDKYNEELK
jgi:hypothetical protein